MAPFRHLARPFAACLPFSSGLAAHACTVCDSPNGRALRAGLFDGHFLHTLGLVLAPAPVLVAAVLLLHLGWPDIVTDRASALSEDLAAPEPIA